MDPDAIEAAITPNTKAIIPVHLFGQMADMNPIEGMEFLKERMGNTLDNEEFLLSMNG